ncbi:MAG: vitamin K epoxide reductase family protein [Verrucomicrobiales bacterium]
MAARKSSKNKPEAASNDDAVPVSPDVASGKPLLLNLGRAALFLAALVAFYLMVTALAQGHVAGCEEGKSCNAVLASKWAKLFGVPIGAFGAASYLALLGLSFVRGLGAARIFLVVTIIGGALWFTAVQAFILKTFCPWCCGTHALAVLGALLVVGGMPRVAKGSLGAGTALLSSACALGAVAVTAVIQFNSADPQPVAVATATEVAPVQFNSAPQSEPDEPTGEVEKAKRSSLTLHDRFELSTVELPSLGDAETADHLAVGIFDFSCIHCRHLMKLLKPMVAEYGDQLAILKMPGFFNENGKEIHKLMLPVFREAPEVYEELGDDLYSEKVKAEAAVVRQELENRLGVDRLNQILAAYGGWAEERVAETKAVIETNRGITKSGKLPQLMVGKSIENGNQTNPGHYYKLFSDQFGLKRAAAPELACVPAKLDLGTVVAYSAHTMKLTLSNPGKIPVAIDAIKRPKGIIVEDVPKSLEPGESQAVTIKLTVPAQQTGKVSTYFEVHSDAAEPVIRIPFTAEVLSIKFDPPTLNFGNMEAGGDPKVLVTTLTLDAPAKLSGTSCPVPYFKSEATEVIEENKSYRIHVSAKFEDGTTGIRNSYAVLFLDPVDPSLAWPKQIRVPLKARVMPKKAP